MHEETNRLVEFMIILVENNSYQRKIMKDILLEAFPHCSVKGISCGIEAMNYLLSPVNEYHLVILDGNLGTFPKTFITPVNGPNIAAAMQEKNIDVPVVLWTRDPDMLARFDEIYGERLPEIEKPCRRSNIEVILRPIIESVAKLTKEGKEQLETNEDQDYTPGPTT